MNIDYLLKGYSNDKKCYVQLVSSMYRSYHNSSVNFLQDQISYHQEGQFLKRFYQQSQLSYKINLLADFYQYHRQLPRIFHSNISPIIQTFQGDWRALQYKFVTKRMKQDPTDQIALTIREKRNRPVQKVLKNIQFSYYNFQNKNVKKHAEALSKQKNKQPTNSLNKSKKSIPLLPLYTYEKPLNMNRKPTVKDTVKILGIKDSSSNYQKLKQKQSLKKGSQNNSTQQTKNLSRNKSKSTLVTAFGFQKTQRVLGKSPQNDFNGQKAKSTQRTLKKAQSTKNILERKKSEGRCEVIKAKQNKQQGLKSMFKRAVQIKKGIKLER